jgi:hypothetical protein
MAAIEKTVGHGADFHVALTKANMRNRLSAAKKIHGQNKNDLLESPRRQRWVQKEN